MIKKIDPYKLQSNTGNSFLDFYLSHHKNDRDYYVIYEEKDIEEENLYHLTSDNNLCESKDVYNYLYNELIKISNSGLNIYLELPYAKKGDSYLSNVENIFIANNMVFQKLEEKDLKMRKILENKINIAKQLPHSAIFSKKNLLFYESNDFFCDIDRVFIWIYDGYGILIIK